MPIDRATVYLTKETVCWWSTIYRLSHRMPDGCVSFAIGINRMRWNETRDFGYVSTCAITACSKWGNVFDVCSFGGKLHLSTRMEWIPSVFVICRRNAVFLFIHIFIVVLVTSSSSSSVFVASQLFSPRNFFKLILAYIFLSFFFTIAHFTTEMRFGNFLLVFLFFCPSSRLVFPGGKG